LTEGFEEAEGLLDRWFEMGIPANLSLQNRREFTVLLCAAGVNATATAVILAFHVSL
jgi:hypothetical protein